MVRIGRSASKRATSPPRADNPVSAAATSTRWTLSVAALWLLLSCAGRLRRLLSRCPETTKDQFINLRAEALRRRDERFDV